LINSIDFFFLDNIDFERISSNKKTHADIRRIKMTQPY